MSEPFNTVVQIPSMLDLNVLDLAVVDEVCKATGQSRQVVLSDLIGVACRQIRALPRPVKAGVDELVAEANKRQQHLLTSIQSSVQKNDETATKLLVLLQAAATVAEPA